MPASTQFTERTEYTGFNLQQLDQTHCVYVGHLPNHLVPDQAQFEKLWNLHPAEYPEILMHGKLVKTPRWQQSYGHDYRYPGQSNAALPIPDLLIPYRDWAKAAIDPRLNGLLLNWYDGKLGHYIGKHRDIITGLIAGSPIVTISLGEERVFRLRPWRGQGWVDIPMSNGTVVIMPWATNAAWTHEVPRSTRYQGRRISVTVRAFARC